MRFEYKRILFAPSTAEILRIQSDVPWKILCQRVFPVHRVSLQYSRFNVTHSFSCQRSRPPDDRKTNPEFGESLKRVIERRHLGSRYGDVPDLV